MKKKLVLLTIVLIGSLILNSCTDNPSKSKKKTSDADCYILCAGNYGSPNASLWQYDGEKVLGPVCWDGNNNYLGDTGESLCFDDDRLFIVLNNSHDIKVLDTETYEEIGVMEISEISPRYMAINDDKGYITGWNSVGIIVIDVDNYSIIDTIAVNGFTEGIVIEDDVLYTAVIKDVMWSNENKVLSFDISKDEPVALDTFEVVPGPEMMYLDGDELLVSSTYWDANWTAYFGMSKINLDTKKVTKKDYGTSRVFQKDLIKINGDIYRASLNGMVKINSDLSFDISSKIGDLPGMVYTACEDNDKIYCSVTDYFAPDTVYVIDDDGEILNSFIVGAIPTAISFVK